MTTTIPSQTVTRTPPRFVLTPKLKTAITMTALTLLGLITGLLGEHTLDNEYVKWGGYGLAYLAGGIPAGREALHSLFVERKLDVDLLMVLAALGAASIGQTADGAILLFLFSLSNTLQDWAMGRTKRAIEALMDLNPEGATVRRDGVEKWCELGDIRIGDLLVVKPGERIAADARVVTGNTSVDESPITGESRPIDKAPGAELASGTVNLNGSVEAEVIRPAGESTLARLVALMEDAQTQKSRTETLSERWESPYATLVLLAVPLRLLQLALQALKVLCSAPRLSTRTRPVRTTLLRFRSPRAMFSRLSTALASGGRLSAQMVSSVLCQATTSV